MLLKTKLIVSGAISLAALYGTVCGVKTINFEGINTSSSQIQQNQQVIESTTEIMNEASYTIKELEQIDETQKTKIISQQKKINSQRDRNKIEHENYETLKNNYDKIKEEYDNLKNQVYN